MVRYNLNGRNIGSIGEYSGDSLNLFIFLIPTFVAQGQHLYVGDPRASEVRIYDESGKLTAIVRTDDPIARTTAAEQAAMQPHGYPVCRDQSCTDRFKERLKNEPRPKDWPSFTKIAVDPDGRLWMLDWKKVRTDPDIWTAFDASGRLLGRLSFAAYTKSGYPFISHFTSGGVEVLRQDDDGATHLTTYPLIPVTGGRP